MEKKLKLAIPNKGRLMGPSLELLTKIGLEFEPTERKLSSEVKNFPLEILYVSALNIPEYVQNKIIDLGITGYDQVKEKGVEVEILQDLDYGEGDLVIAVPEKSKIKKIKDLKNKKIGTSYSNLVKTFLRKNKIKAEIIEIEGAVEAAPGLGLVDAIVDLSATGATLRINNLRPIETILKTRAILIANKKSLKEKEEIIETLILRIKSVLNAKEKIYLMMNAPENILEDIKKITPGLASPTVMKLAKKGMIAVHSVVDTKDIWRTIERLKKIGASGILVIPIDKLVF